MLLLVVLAAGCNGGGGGSGSTTGKVSIAVKDGPVEDADHVVVTFTGIELLQGDSVAKSVTFATPQSIDLLGLQGENHFFLVQDEEVPPGVYDSIRLLTGITSSSCSLAMADKSAVYLHKTTPKDPDARSRDPERGRALWEASLALLERLRSRRATWRSCTG